MKNNSMVAKICILTSGHRHTLCYLLIFFIDLLLCNYEWNCCYVNFHTLIPDIILEYFEYASKMVLAYLHEFSYFPFSSTKLGTLCYPLGLFMDVPFILKYFFMSSFSFHQGVLPILEYVLEYGFWPLWWRLEL